MSGGGIGQNLSCLHPSPLKGLHLTKRARKTDFIGDLELRGFYVNEKLKSILENLHLPNHSFIPIKFLNEKTGQMIEEYYRFVYDMETGENTVDFDKCEFDFKLPRSRLAANFKVSIKSYSDYLNVFYDTGIAVKVSKLVFNKNFDQELDIFGTQFLGLKSAYISDRLLKRFQKAKITGYSAVSPEQSRRSASLLGDSYTELIFE